MADYHTHKTSWQSIALSVGYCPDWSSAFKNIYGRPLAHLTIQSPCRLPITEIGYLSHFVSPDLMEAEGGPLEFVAAWLDHDAQLPDWKTRQEKVAQLTLF